jgi:UDP-glucose 4-epimerase
MKKIAIVTGGAGFIGSNISADLNQRGYDVKVVDNLSTGKRERIPPGVSFYVLDILDTKALALLFRGADVVFHQAALPRVPFSIEHPQEAHQANIDGTLSVLLAAREAHVRRVVYAASGSAYGNQSTLPYQEDMTPNPVHPYGLQKYVGELYMKIFAEVYKIETVSLRYFNVYGPGMDPSGSYGLAIAKFLEQRKAKKPLTIVGDGTQTRDFTHVKDVVRANILAAESARVGKGEVINIGTGRNVSVNHLADLIGGAERVWLAPRIEGHDSRADNTRAKELLGWEPRISLEDGIAELKQAMEIS